MDKLRVGIVVGTIREGRFGESAARWLESIAAGRPDLATEIVDLRDYSLPLYGDPDLPVTGSALANVLSRWSAKMAELDGYVFVTAEYNHGPSGVLKNAIDYLGDEVKRKPAAFLGYGGVGGARAVEQLRLILVELHMTPIRDAVHIGGEAFWNRKQEAGGLSAHSHLTDSANAMLDDLTWWAETLRAGRSGSRTATEFALATSSS